MIVYGTAEWASVFEPNSMSGKFQVDICNLDKNTVKKLGDEGIPVKEGEVKGDGKDTTHKGSLSLQNLLWLLKLLTVLKIYGPQQ